MATAGGIAHSQLHPYWCTISDAVSRKRKPARVTPLDSRLSCWRHKVAVHLLTVERTRLFGPRQLGIIEPAAALGIDLGTAQLIRNTVALGFNLDSARQAMH